MSNRIEYLEPGSISDHTQIIQEKLDRLSAEGGGKLVLTPGVFQTSTVHLRSNLHVQLEMGAIWKGSPNVTDYEKIQSPITSRMDAQPWAVFISGINLENVLLEGPGLIDGNGASESFQLGMDDDPRRPYGLRFVGCSHVTVRNLSLQNSGFWMQRYLGCRNLRLQGLNVYNHSNFNNDGMDIDGCEDVTISDCVIDAADDGICIKSEGALPTRNVVISNCRVASFASAFKFGTGSLSGFENIVLSNCIFHKSRSKVMTHSLNLWTGISAFDFGSVDGGFMRNISVSHCLVEGYLNLFNLRLSKRNSRVLNHGTPDKDPRPILDHTGEGMPPITVGSMENIRFSGITATGVGHICANVSGYAGNPVRNVTLTDIDLHLGASGVQEDVDEVPNWNDAGYPCAIAYTNLVDGVWPPTRWHGLPAYGLSLRHVEDVTFNNFRVTPVPGDPRPELYFSDGVQRVVRDGKTLV